jgi:hypothetical protein
MGGGADHLKIGTAILTLKQLRDAPNEGGSGWRCEQLQRAILGPGLWSDSTRHVDLAPRNAAQQLLNTEARLLRPRHIVGRVHRDLLTLFRLNKGDMASEAASWAAMSLQDNPDHQAGSTPQAMLWPGDRSRHIRQWRGCGN